MDVFKVIVRKVDGSTENATVIASDMDDAMENASNHFMQREDVFGISIVPPQDNED